MLEKLKDALGRRTISDFMRTLRNPNGQKVHRTTLYKAINTGSPRWLVEEIEKVIEGNAIGSESSTARDRKPDQAPHQA